MYFVDFLLLNVFVFGYTIQRTKMKTVKKGLSAQNLWSRWMPMNWLYLWCVPVAIRAVSTDFSSLKFRLRTQESARCNGDRLQRAWKLERADERRYLFYCYYYYRTPSILRALFSIYGRDYVFVGAYKLLWGLFTWLCAYYFLKQSLSFVQDSLLLTGKPDVIVGHGYALALLASALLSSIFIQQLYGECNRIGIQVKSALNVLIYRKVLTLSRIRGGSGEVVNVITITKIK